MRRRAKLERLIREAWWKPEFTNVADRTVIWRLGAYQVVREGLASDALFAFMGLLEAQDTSRFATFARECGVLNLDHSGMPRPLPSVGGNDLIDRTAEHREALQQWRAYAQNAVLLLAFANALHDGEDEGGLLSDVVRWNSLQHATSNAAVPHGLTDARLIGKTTAEKRGDLAERLQRFWISPSRIAPVFDWEGKSPHVELRAGAPHPLIEHDDFPGVYWTLPSAFDVLAAELTNAILTNQRLVRCDRCDELMLMSRKPRSDQPHYCPICAPIVYREITLASKRKRYRQDRESAARPTH